MKKSMDPITQTFVLLIVVIVLTIIAFQQQKKSWFIAAGITSLAFVIRGISATKSPALILENDYKGNGCYKCESETECIIRPLAQLDAQTAVDGINTGFRSGEVFKLSNGINAHITASGDVRPYSIVSRWFAGWRDRSYFEKKGVLAQWQPLFDCSIS